MTTDLNALAAQETAKAQGDAMLKALQENATLLKKILQVLDNLASRESTVSAMLNNWDSNGLPTVPWKEE